MKRISVFSIAIISILLVLVASSPSQENVESRSVNIWSDGTRLSGNLFFPENIEEGDKLPAIILCHGWGGVRAHLNQAYAPRIAAAG